MEMKSYLSPNNTKALKGIMAIAVVLSHIYTSGVFRFESSALAFIFGSVLGYVPVSVFFFLSGYGLMCSYKSKGKDYIRHFPRNRLLPFYITIVLAIIIYFILHISMGDGVSLFQLFKSFTLGGTIITYGWYLQTILLLYFIFWLCFSLKIEDTKKVYVFCLAVSILYVVSYFIGVTPTWYATAPCMAFGMIWNQFGDKIDMWINSKIKKWIYIILSLFMCGVSKIVSGFLPGEISYIFQVTLTAIFFTATVVLLLKGIFLYNPITGYLGKISLEIYVFQGAIITIVGRFEPIKQNVFLYGLIIIVATIVVASVFNPIINILTQMVKRKGVTPTVAKCK